MGNGSSRMANVDAVRRTVNVVRAQKTGAIDNQQYTKRDD